MPDHNPRLARMLLLLMLIVAALSAISLVAIGVGVSYSNSASKSADAASTAVSNLRKSSARTECRTQLINSEADVVSHEILHFQQNIDKLLLLSNNPDKHDQAIALAKSMAADADHALARPSVQKAIDAQCPPALVDSTTYTVAP